MKIKVREYLQRGAFIDENGNIYYVDCYDGYNEVIVNSETLEEFRPSAFDEHGECIEIEKM